MIAYSKINLHLAIVKKREDGYHELDTLFFPVKEIFDVITLETEVSEKQGIQIICDHPDVPTDPQQNLCGKAVIAYFKAANKKDIPGLVVNIKKNIPIAGGMGGGSSDAAITLKLLQQYYNLLSEFEIENVALKLGADVPFFLKEGVGHGRGIGERLEYISNFPTQLPIRIAAPRFPVSAAWVYKHHGINDFKKNSQFPLEKLIDLFIKGDFVQAASLMRNDLENCIVKKFPILQVIKDEFYNIGALKVMVSGSGPTMFALFPSFEKAAQCSQSKLLSNYLL